MNVPLFLVLLGSLSLTHLHFTYPTATPPPSEVHPTTEKSEFWNKGNVFHLKNMLNEKEERILTFAINGFSSASNGAPLVSTKRSPDGQTWLTSLPNGETLKMAKTRPLSDKKGDHAPLAEYSVTWKVTKKLQDDDKSREVCFLYDTTPTMPPATPTRTHWYSTFLENRQAWPLNSETGSSAPFKATPLTTSSSDAPIGSTVEYLFYSSAGFVIFLDDLHPWTIAVNESTFCLSIPQMATPPEDHPREYASLKWRILIAPDLPSLWRATLGTLGYISRPATPPSSSLLQRLIWPVSLIPKQYSEDWVADIASFKEHPNYANACLYIDKEYQWGNAPFVLPGKSGDQRSLIEALQKAGSHIAYHLSQAFNRKATPNGTSCVDASKGNPTKSGNPPTSRKPTWCTLDFTHAQTALWFTSSLEEFTQRTAISTFFLKDATVDAFFPKEKLHYKVENFLLLKYPNFLTTLYSSSVLPVGRGRGFVIDGAFKSQRLSTFITFNMEVEEEDDSHPFSPSGSRAVLSRLIPKLLTLSLAGYQFAFPQVSLPTRPNQEEYLRWLAACLFLPAFQVSVSPWNLLEEFDFQMVKLLELRVAVYEQVHMEVLVDEWIHRGVPLIRPMWAADAGDDQLLTIADQYMLGNRLVVAPYLGKKNDKTELYERTVYLPRGAQWSDSKGNSLQGGVHIKVNSTVVDPPYFTRQEKGNSGF